MDTNKDGKVSWKEFDAYYRKLAEKQAAADAEKENKQK